MQIIDPCSICGKQVSGDSIFCNSCNCWVHPNCNLLSKSEFDLRVNLDDTESWCCLKCSCGSLPEACFVKDPSVFPNSNYNHGNNNCNFYDISSFNHKQFDNNCLSFLHTNICSLNKHFDNLQAFLNSLNHNFKVIGVSENRIKSDEIHYNLEGYKTYITPTKSEEGGTSLYISESLKSSRRPDLETYLYSDKLLESTFCEISINNNSIIAGVIYKHPSMLTSTFLDLLGPTLDKINREGKITVLLGDFNIDLLKRNDPNVIKFIDSLSSYSLNPYITLPTRINLTSKTLIDNIFISSNSFQSCSGNFTTSISDHLIQFTILESFNYSNSSNQPKFYKDWKDFNSNNFAFDFNNIHWDELMSLEMKDPNHSFDIFYNKLLLINMYQLKNSLKSNLNVKISLG